MAQPALVELTRRPGYGLFRQLFVPALLATSIGSWAHHEATERYLKAARLGMDHSSAALLVSLLLIWLAEQVYPANPEWNYNVASDPARGLSRLSRDIFYLFFVTLLSAVLIRAAAGQVEPAIAGLGLRPLWPRSAPLPARIALAFFGIELGSYWLHRAAHRFELLWRFHSTHHVITELTGLKAVRTHPVDNVLFYVARHAPLLLLGAGPDELLAAGYFAAVLGVLSHANVSVAEGWLGWVVNLPQYHAVHHSAELAESQSNFGCHTVLWDRLFGTFRRAGPGLEVGVRPVGPRSAWQELGWPFYRSIQPDE